MTEEVFINLRGEDIVISVDGGSLNVFDSRNADAVLQAADSASTAAENATTAAADAEAAALAAVAATVTKADLTFGNVDPATGRTALGVPSSAALALPSGGTLINTIRTETGAIRRSVQDVLRDRVSVKDFGAVGDGANRPLSSVTSLGGQSTSGWTLTQWQVLYPFATSTGDQLDFCAFQAAANTGKLVDVPSGAYLLNRQIDVRAVVGSDGATFQGDGFASTIVTILGATDDGFNFTTCSGAGIHDMTMRCVGTRTAGAAVRFKDSNDLRSFGMRFQSVGANKFFASYIFDGGSNQFLYHIEGHQISGGVWGIINGSDGTLVQDLWVGKGVINNCDEVGIDLRDCSGIFLYGWGDVLGSKHGLRTFPASGRIVTGLLISGFLADTNRNHGIYLTTNGGTVSNVTMNAWAASTGTVGEPLNSPLSNGLMIDQASGLIDGVTVQGQYYNNLTSGIAVVAARDVHIENALIGYNSRGTSNLFSGVYFGPSALNCSITGGVSGAVGLFRARDSITTFQSYGVQIDVGATNTRVTGVNVSSNVTAGVKNDGTGSLIRDCVGYRTQASGTAVLLAGQTSTTVAINIDAPLIAQRVSVQVFGNTPLWCSGVVGQVATITAIGPVPGDTFFQVNVDQSF